MWSVTSDYAAATLVVHSCVLVRIHVVWCMRRTAAAQHPHRHTQSLCVAVKERDKHMWNLNAEQAARRAKERATKRNFLWLWFSTHSLDYLYSFVFRFLRFPPKPVRVCTCVCVRRSSLASSHTSHISRCLCCLCVSLRVYRSSSNICNYYAFHTQILNLFVASISKIFLYWITFHCICLSLLNLLRQTNASFCVWWLVRVYVFFFCLQELISVRECIAANSLYFNYIFPLVFHLACVSEWFVFG